MLSSTNTDEYRCSQLPWSDAQTCVTLKVCSHKYRLMALLDYSRFKLWFKQHLSGNLLSQSEQGSDFLCTNTAPLNSQWSTAPLDWWGGLSQKSLMGSQAKWFCATCGNVTLNYVAWRISKLEVIVNDKQSGFMFTEVHRETSLWYESIRDDTFTIGIPATSISSWLEELKWVQRVSLLVNLPSDPHLWWGVVGSDRKYKISYTDVWNESPREGGQAQNHRYKWGAQTFMFIGANWGGQGMITMLPQRLHGEAFLGTSSWEETLRQTHHALNGLHFPCSPETLWCSPGGAGGGSWGEDGLGFCPERDKRRKWKRMKFIHSRLKHKDLCVLFRGSD